MKLKTAWLAASLVFFANTSTAFANDEHHDAPKVDATKSGTAEVKKPMKKHNHMEEKTNMPMPAPANASGKEMSKEMHEHMHDHMKEKR